MTFNPDDPAEHKTHRAGDLLPRPVYETQYDLSNEDLFRHEVEVSWRVELQKLPRRYVVDFAAFRDGQIKSIIEFKCRTISMTAYDTFGLSLHKWLHGARMAEELGVPFLLCVRWSDPVSAFYKYEPMGANPIVPTNWIAPGGRKDRDDPEDQEVWVYIPISNFKEIR